jgi:RHS repeat-associated protein
LCSPCWSLSAHHVYDPASRTLYRGDGGRRNSDGIGANVRIFGGVPGGAGGVDPDGTPALQAHFGQINGLVMDEAGTLYAAQTSGGEDIRKIDKGVVTTFAGVGPSGHSGDGGPATLAQLDYPSGLVALRDGRICFSEFYRDSIRCVGTDGIVRPLAGGGAKDLGALPVPSLEAKVTRPGELAEGPDGSILVTLSAVNMIARIDRAGTIEIAAGGGLDAGEGVPALNVDLQTPRGLAVAADGSVYVAEAGRNRIRRIDPSGRVTTFAGSGDAGNTGDGGFATSATFKRPTALALDGTGALFVADQGNSRIRRIDGGKVQAFAGGGDRRSGPGAAARLASVNATAMVVARDGTLYAANDDDHTVLVFSAAFPGAATTDIVMPNEDGSELYVFDGRGRHLRTLDGLTTDVLTSFTYDAAGRLTRIEDRHGNALDIVRDAATGRATRITSPFGHATDLGYDADGWLATVTDPIGRKESFAYAPGGLLTQRIDAGGGLHAMAYDALGRLTRDATAENASFDLVGGATATTVTSGLGRREVHTFTGGLDRDDVRSYQAPDGTVTPWTSRRDGTANIALPDGTVIDITREADPRLGMLVPYAAKHLVSFPSGLSRSITQVWSAQLDANGGLTELKGDRSSPDGRSTTVYDGSARVLTSTSPEGRVVKVTLDGEGRLARAEYPGRMPLTFAYDGRGRLASVDEGGRTTRSSYDAQSGALAKVENALGQGTSVERDGALRSTAFVHADGARSLLAWSAMDDLVGVTPPGKGQHVMDFAKDGNEVRYTPPGGAPLAFGYDLDRALASVMNEDGSASTLGYDTAGRVTSVTYPGGPLAVAYDPKTGQVRTLTTPGSALAIDYDGLLVRGVTATGPAPGTVTFTYDAMLRRGSEQVGTSTVKYGYDHDGLLTQAGSVAVGRESASGLISGIDVVNVAQRFTHTPFGELATYRSQGAGGNVLDVALTYDALARIVDKVENGAAWHYDYDVRGRLTHVRKDAVDIATYAYDANGNRADGAAVIDAQDRVLSMNGATYTYSAAGERLTRTTGAGQTTYAYDARGYLSSVMAPGNVRADYDLDAYGRRITKRRNGTVQNRFLYRNALQPIADADAAGALISRYIYARGELGPDALERAGATYLLLKDERGSIRYVIDATSRAVAQALTYDAFGRVLSDTSPGFQPFGFAGGIYDADTGLVHFGARDYDPETGSFTRKDPSRFGGGENLYAYAGGDPINFVDPDGESVVGAVVGGLEGAIINYAEEGATQALDPNSTGYDCDKIRSAAKVGAIVGAVSGATKARGKQCFAAGTEVATENGPKAIEAIAVGDRVLSSTEEGEVSYQPVTRVFQRSGAEEVALTFTDAHGVGAPVVTTPEHPFRVASGEWVAAGRLDIGDNVVTAEGGLATLSAALSLEKSGTVHNFEVAGTHTYFVGSAKLWVHNACKGQKGGEPGTRPYKPFTKAGKAEVWSRNSAEHGGANRCVLCGTDVVKPKQHTGGVTPPANEGQVDHYDPRSKGGSGTAENGDLLCLFCNNKKSNK